MCFELGALSFAREAKLNTEAIEFGAELEETERSLIPETLDRIQA